MGRQNLESWIRIAFTEMKLLMAAWFLQAGSAEGKQILLIWKMKLMIAVYATIPEST